MEVLNMLLTCLVNDTTNETAISYNYASTKLNETDAVLMNLPNIALGFVPWLCNYDNSAQGRTPHDFGEWLVEKLEEIGEFFIGIFVAIWNAITLIWETIVEFISEVLMDAIPWLAYMLWLLVRAAVAVIMYILFVLFLVLVVIGFIALVPILILLNYIIKGEIEVSINSLTIHKNNDFITLEYTIGIDYCEFFDLSVPSLYLFFKTNGSTFSFPFNLFTNNIGFPSNEFFDALNDVGDNETVSESSVRMSSSESGDQLLSGVAVAITIVAMTLTITSAILNFNDSPFETLVSIITFTLAVASIVTSTIFFIGYIVEADELTESFAVGFRIGMFISMFVSILIGFLSISYFPLLIIYTILNIVLAAALLSEDFENLNDFKKAYFDNPSVSMDLEYERKNVLTYNLLGDPSLDIYTDIPSPVMNPFIEEVYEGQFVNITVKNVQESVIPNARVHLSTPDGIYRTFYADDMGRCNFTIPALGNKSYNVVVTGHNVVPSYFNFTTLLDEIEPEIYDLKINKKTFNQSEPIYFDVKARDSISGVEKVFIVISKDNFSNYNMYEMKNHSGGNNNQFECFVDDLEPGVYSYLSIARDYANNTAILYNKNYNFEIVNPLLNKRAQEDWFKKVIFAILFSTLVGVISIFFKNFHGSLKDYIKKNINYYFKEFKFL